MTKPKRRRLSDLYQVGQSVSFDDGSGEEPIELYMRRPNPFEHEEALKEGNAARARIALKMRDPKTDDYEIIENDLASIGNQYKLVDFILSDGDVDLSSRAYAKVASEDKWTEDSLLESITDNLAKWEDAAIDANHEEWDDFQRAKDKYDEFEAEVQKEIELMREERRVTLLEDKEEETREKARRILIDRAAGLAFFKHYRLACIYYAVREPDDHTKRYFLSRQEVSELPYEVQNRLLITYEEIDLAREEVKNSPSADLSSEESAPTPAEETSESSGPEESSIS